MRVLCAGVSLAVGTGLVWQDTRSKSLGVIIVTALVCFIASVIITKIKCSAELRITIKNEDTAPPSFPQPPSLRFLQFWELFRFALSRKVREKVFEPLFEEFKEDFLLAQSYTGKWETRWIKFWFTCKTAAMIVGCFRVMVSTKSAQLLWGLVPEPIRKFFSS